MFWDILYTCGDHKEVCHDRIYAYDKLDAINEFNSKWAIDTTIISVSKTDMSLM